MDQPALQQAQAAAGGDCPGDKAEDQPVDAMGVGVFGTVAKAQVHPAHLKGRGIKAVV